MAPLITQILIPSDSIPTFLHKSYNDAHWRRLATELRDSTTHGQELTRIACPENITLYRKIYDKLASTVRKMKVSTCNDAFFKLIDIVHRESMLNIDTDSASPYRTTPWYHAITFVYSNRNHKVLNKLIVAQYFKKFPLF